MKKESVLLKARCECPRVLFFFKLIIIFYCDYLLMIDIEQTICLHELHVSHYFVLSVKMSRMKSVLTISIQKKPQIYTLLFLN